MNKKLKTLLSLSLIVGTLSFGGVYVSADTTKSMGDIPVTSDEAAAKLIDMTSLKVSKQDVKPGESVKVSFKAAGEIKTAIISYIKPISHKAENVKMTYNEETGLYEGNITVEDKSESGQWEMVRMLVQDSTGEYKNIFDKNLVVGASNGEDLSVADFNVSGTKVVSKDDIDAEGPKVDLSSLSIDKSEVYPKDKINISLKAEDESGVNWINVNYLTPQGYSKIIDLKYNEINGRYEGTIEADNEYGIWKINDITAVDNEYNGTYIGNKEMVGESENTDDLSAGNFEVKQIEVEEAAPIPSLNLPDNSSIKIDLSKIKVSPNLKISDDAIKLG